MVLPYVTGLPQPGSAWSHQGVQDLIPMCDVQRMTLAGVDGQLTLRDSLRQVVSHLERNDRVGVAVPKPDWRADIFGSEAPRTPQEQWRLVRQATRPRAE